MTSPKSPIDKAKNILAGQKATSYPGSFFGEGKTLVGAGHVNPQILGINYKFS